MNLNGIKDEKILVINWSIICSKPSSTNKSFFISQKKKKKKTVQCYKCRPTEENWKRLTTKTTLHFGKDKSRKKDDQVSNSLKISGH